MAILGIDLGTTNSLGAVYRNGKVELIPNRFGSFLTPSVVSVMEDGSVVTGQIAKERLITHPEGKAYPPRPCATTIWHCISAYSKL